METAPLYTRRLLGFFLPFLGGTSAAEAAAAVAVLGAAAALVHAAPERSRKPILTALAALYVARFAGPGFAAAHLLLAAALCWAVRGRASLALRLLPAAAAAAACALAARPEGLGRLLGLSLLALSAVKAVSLCVDAAAQPRPPAFTDAYLYLAGGVPCNFMGPKYTFASFQRSYLARPYREIALQGGAMLACGALKLCAAAALESAVPLSAAADASTSRLWALVSAAWAADLLRLIGVYDVLQGSNRLFGFDVQDQFRAPWLAQSPLDFWRRFGVNNRDYLLKYVFYPARRLGSGLYSALAAAFLASALWNLLIALVVGGGPRSRYDDPARVAVLWLVLFALFASAAALEAALHGQSEAALGARLGAGPARAARVAATWLFIAAIQAPMPYVLDLAYRGPGSSESGLPRRYAGLYGRLLGLR